MGNLYGSRISKNGKWLNLQVKTKIGEKEYLVTCPVHISEDEDEDTGKKPYAVIEKACDVNGNHYPVGKALIAGIPIYENAKSNAEEPIKPSEDDCPF